MNGASMTLTREEISKSAVESYDGFADLLDSLSAADWDQPTCCDGWAVRDVAGHVVAVMEDVVEGKVGSRTPAQEAADLRGEEPGALAARLRTALVSVRALFDVLDDDAWNGPSPAPDSVHDGTLGNAVLVLWNDAVVHGDDIRRATGRPPEPADAFTGTLELIEESLTAQGWGPARVELAGQRTLQIGDGGPTHTVDTHDFVLAATGRLDPQTIGLDETVNIYR
jgi:uncharacterized protein (TIGR03083 family)